MEKLEEAIRKLITEQGLDSFLKSDFYYRNKDKDLMKKLVDELN